MCDSCAFRFKQGVDPACDHFVKKTHASRNFLLAIRLPRFVQTATPNKLRERPNVLREKHGIMQQLFVAFVTVGATLGFMEKWVDAGKL